MGVANSLYTAKMISRGITMMHSSPTTFAKQITFPKVLPRRVAFVRRCNSTKPHQSNYPRQTQKVAEQDEELRQKLLDRDGGSAGVPTREGKWDQAMGRETARQMFRVLDQVRVNKPGTSFAQGEGESKGWSRRNT